MSFRSPRAYRKRLEFVEPQDEARSLRAYLVLIALGTIGAVCAVGIWVLR